MNGWDKIGEQIAANRKAEREGRARAKQKLHAAKKTAAPKKKAKKKARPPTRRKKLDPFFSTVAWKMIRYDVLKRDGGRCQLCGMSSHDGIILNVDHIKPRRKFPALALSIDNLQTLCSSCNWGKLERDQTDWRLQREATDEATERFREIMANPKA